MRSRFVSLLGIFFILAAPAFAADDCPPGFVKHPTLTALDDPTMLAAWHASYVGLYGHEPSLRPGSGLEDGHYWISVSNHYGAFSDGACRAGWSAYWEAKLLGSDSAPPSLGDQPARFRPESPAPPVVVAPAPPPVIPPPAPLPSAPNCDPTVIAKLDQIQGTAQQTDADVQAFRAAAKSKWDTVSKFTVERILPALAAWWAGTHLGK